MPRGRPITGVRVSIRIPADVLDDVDLTAKRCNRSRAEQVRRILLWWADGADNLPADQLAQIDAAAAESGTTRAQIIRQLIANGLVGKGWSA